MSGETPDIFYWREYLFLKKQEMFGETPNMGKVLFNI